MTQPNRRLGFGAIDGIIALVLITYGFLPGSHLHHTVLDLLGAHIRTSDAAFAICFLYLWRYCFSLLKLYDKFATISSRMMATLQGVATMFALAVGYYEIAHPHFLKPRAAVLTFLGLYCYEVNRAAVSAHLLDRLAARDPRGVIIIGSGRRASKAWRAVRTRYRLSLHLIGFVDDRNPEDMPPDVARRYLGSLNELNEILLKDVVDLLLIAMPIQSCYPLMQRAIHIADSAGVKVLYLEDIYSSREQKEDPNQSIFRELAPDQEHYLMFLATKRVVDICGALLGLTLFAPLFLLIALAIKLTSKGPVFFQQERCGHRRRRFTMWKFRTMVANAEQLLPYFEPADVADGPIFKVNFHPRVIPVGRILSKTSLDELPQLWNVLVGDMSLVGPRPMSIRDVSLFDKAALIRRFSVRPGMTGLWQVSGRSSTGSDQWIIMDNRYIDRRSLSLDAKILARTIGVVLRRSAAM